VGPASEEPPDPLELTSVALELTVDVTPEPLAEPPPELPRDVPEWPLELRWEALLTLRAEVPPEPPVETPLELATELPPEPALDAPLELPTELPPEPTVATPLELATELPPEPALDALLELAAERRPRPPPVVLPVVALKPTEPPLELPGLVAADCWVAEPGPAAVPPAIVVEEGVPHPAASPSATPKAASTRHVVLIYVLPVRGTRRPCPRPSNPR
jgi:hypothetical protein